MTAQFWWSFFGTLTALACGMIYLAALVDWWVDSADWRRLGWRVALLGMLVAVLGEVTGVGGILQRQMQQWRTSRQSAVAANPGPLDDGKMAGSIDLEMARPSLLPSRKSSTADVPAVRIWWPMWVWLSGASLLGLRAVVGRGCLWQLRRRRQASADDDLRSKVSDLAERLGVRRHVRIALVARLNGPFTFGLFRPTIWLPAEFTSDFSERQQVAVLAHELAHVAAWDVFWHGVANWTRALLWWNPLVWWAVGRWRAASETSADRASLAVKDGPMLLAETLVLLGRRLASTSKVNWLGLEGRRVRSDLGRRVQQLLACHGTDWNPVSRRQKWVARGLTLAVCLGLLLATGQWSATNGADEPEAAWHRSLAGRAVSGLFAQATPAVAPSSSPSPSPSASPAKPGLGDISKRVAILTKLDSIMFDQVAFDDVPLPSVIKTLRDQSIAKDPQGRGVNFILASSLNDAIVRLRPALTGITMKEALDAIVLQASVAAEYAIADLGVVIRPRPTNAPALFTRWFKVDRSSFDAKLLQLLGTSAVNGNDQNAMSLNLRMLLAAAGVNVTWPGSMFTYQHEWLMARAPLPDLDLVEQIIQMLSTPPPQVLLEMVWGEVMDNTVLPGAKGVTGILTESQFKEFTRSLPGLNPSASRKVTTVSGRSANFEVMIPRFIKPDVPSTPTNPTQAETMVQPLVIEAVPTVLSDGYTLKLGATASFKDVPGFKLEQPPAREENLTLWDGQTMVLGWRVQDLAQPKQILLFITPVLIDPAGNRVHSPEQLVFAKDLVPGQKPGDESTGGLRNSFPGKQP